LRSGRPGANQSSLWVERPGWRHGQLTFMAESEWPSQSALSMILRLKSSLQMVHNAPIVGGRTAKPAHRCDAQTQPLACPRSSHRDFRSLNKKITANPARPAPNRGLEFRLRYPTTMATQHHSALPSMLTGDAPRVLARLPTVLKMTGLGRSTIYRWIAEGSFPAPVRLGRRAVAWRWSDLDRWTQSRATTHH
jgi:prophage regulatory protein